MGQSDAHRQRHHQTKIRRIARKACGEHDVDGGGRRQHGRAAQLEEGVDVVGGHRRGAQAQAIAVPGRTFKAALVARLVAGGGQNAEEHPRIEAAGAAGARLQRGKAVAPPRTTGAPPHRRGAFLRALAGPAGAQPRARFLLTPWS